MAKSVRKYEIWMCNFPQENSLIKGYRPCVVVSNNFTNTNPECGIATVVPLTSSNLKGGLPTHMEVFPNVNINKLKSSSIVLAEQMTTVNKDDIRFCLGKLTLEQSETLDKVVMIALGIMPYEKIE